MRAYIYILFAFFFSWAVSPNWHHLSFNAFVAIMLIGILIETVDAKKK